MPVHKAIMMVLALVSSFFWVSNEWVGNLSANCESQPAYQEDRKQLAEKAIAEGKVLESQGTADSLRKALENYEKALGIFRTLGDRRAEAETLGHIGVVLYFLDEQHKARNAFQQEIQLWHSLEDRSNEAEALNNIGVVYGALGEQQKSIDAYQQALPLRRAVGDRRGIANTLDNIGMAYLGSGELQKALDNFSQALAIFRELNERAGVANTLNNTGGVHMIWGDNRKALEYFVQALELRHELGQRREEAMALNNIGQAYLYLGDAQKAMDYHLQALELTRVLGQRSGQAASINNVGFVYDTLGEKQKALEHYKQALDIFRALSDRNGEASTLTNIGAFHVNTLGDPKTALEYYLQSLELRRAMRQPAEEAKMLDNIGFIYKTLGDLPKTLEYHRKALEMNRTVGQRQGEGASLTNLGATYFAMGELQTSLDYFNEALLVHRTIGNRSLEATALFGIAQVERARGNLDQARSQMEESLKIIESMRAKVASQDLRASFLAQQQDYYEFYTDLLMRLHQREPSKGHDLAALPASERTRARSLLELLAEARVDVEQGIAPELKQHERATHSRISWLQSRLIEAYSQAKPDKNKILPLEDELKRVDAEREQLTMEIRQKHPRYANLQYPSPLGLKDIQSLLDDRTLLLEYALGKESSFLFAVTSSNFVVTRLPSASSISEQVQALRQMITSRPQRNQFGKQIQLSRTLYRELVEPAGKLLSGKQKLIIVPSGILHYLPFEVLLSSGEERTLSTAGLVEWPYLVREYAISYVPSAGVLASLRSRPEERPGPRKQFLAFADPLYGNETGAEASLVQSRLRGAFGDQQSWKLARLPGSRREVEQIAGLYAQDQVSLLLGHQATEQNVKTAGRLSQYRFIHFATHGLLNEERPPYSGLVLSLSNEGKAPPSATTKTAQAGQAEKTVDRSPQSAIRNPQFEDGLLQVYEVFNLKLNADLVVLSACESGLGKEVKGEGLIGLTHAFLYAGTTSVLVSLWNVQDHSTADLMVSVYQQLDRAQDKTEALRQAKLKLIKNNRYAHPYYWAPFILIGEPK
jgi:CHAT domain-containing protein/Tfp pilus assembly protein PilF